MRIRNGITSVFLLVATLFTGNAFAADTYTVAAEITHADGPVGSPTVVVNAGTPASVEPIPFADFDNMANDKRG